MCTGEASLTSDVDGRGNQDRLRDFDYDDNGRLTGYADYDRVLDPESCTEDPDYGFICTDESSRTLIQQTTFGYDVVGNRTDLGATVETGNRLTAFDGYSMAYDSAGNLTSKTGNGLTQTLSWNGLGQLTSVTTNGTTISFGYDAFGRRVRKTVGSTETTYIYDGQQVFAELDGSENIVAVYTYYPGIDRPHMMERGGARYYYGFDVPGNILGLFNGAGLQNEYGYSPFGRPGTVSESVSNPYRYMARRYDSESGLYFMRARYYDPDLARFVSEDPIGLEGGVNPYAFVVNNPANARDPLGLCEEAEIYMAPDGNYYGYFPYCNDEKDGQSLRAMIEAEWWAMTQQIYYATVTVTTAIASGGGGASLARDALKQLPQRCRAAIRQGASRGAQIGAARGAVLGTVWGAAVGARYGAGQGLVLGTFGGLAVGAPTIAGTVISTAAVGFAGANLGGWAGGIVGGHVGLYMGVPFGMATGSATGAAVGAGLGCF